MTFKTAPDFENPTDGDANNSYVINVIASDGINEVNQDVIITVTDVNEAATGVDLGNTAISENNSIGDEVGDLTTTDEDSGDTHIHSLVSGAGDLDNESFEIVDNTLVTKVVFDFETKNSYSVRIKTTDMGGLSYEEAFVITIVNVSDALIRVESTNPTDPTGVGQITTIPVTIFNDGDGPLTITSVLYPNGFTGLASLPTIEAFGSIELSVSFAPTGARTYTGNLVFVYDRGVFEQPISAVGEIVTSIDPGGIREQDVILFPNPSAQYVTLDLEAFNGAPVDIRVVSESGAGLYNEKEVRSASHRVNVSTLSEGLYIVIIRSECNLVRKKITVSCLRNRFSNAYSGLKGV